jgi:hypothetical protein
MNGDFSRQTFRPSRGYSGVLMQQGRVQLDADWNEEHAIQQHRTETESVDVIGRSGTPKPGGFKVDILPGGADLQIGGGHYYVDGLLCSNDAPLGAPVRLTAQPHLFTPIAPLPDGRYLIYLDVWERHVTSVEDPGLREPALNGEDTTTRLQTIWQVKYSRQSAVGSNGCETLPVNWSPDPAVRGTMRAWSEPHKSSGGSCFIPETGGFRGLENQLYRVEVHKGGALLPGATGNTGLVFKWSRDNGTVLSAIQPAAGSNAIVGADITLENVGRDDTLGFFAGQTVEAIDDRAELEGQPGGLMTIVKDDLRATRRFTLSGSVNLDAARHPRLRRWDGFRDISTDPNGIELEFGVHVAFDAGEYRAGDYWLIPARTVTSANTGTVEWQTDSSGNPLPMPPRGIKHHFAPLAMVNSVGGLFQTNGVSDCRHIFPSLTNITANDVGYENSGCQLFNVKTVQEALDVLCSKNSDGTCTVTLRPGMDLTQAIAQIANGADANICLEIGTFTLDKPLAIVGKGHLKITGSGDGTRLICKSETALLIENCTSAAVRDLYAESQITREKNLRGAITIIDTPDVLIEHVGASCATGAVRAASCIYVRNQAVMPRTSARILHNDLVVGHSQVGVLVINTQRSLVEDNTIYVGAKKSPARELVKNRYYRGLIRNRIFSGMDLNVAATATARNARVSLGGQAIYMNVHPRLASSTEIDNNALQLLINDRSPAGIFTPADLRAFLVREIDSYIVNLPDVRPVADPAMLKIWALINALFTADQPVASQGITIAGTRVEEARVFNNTMSGVLQGIHIGVSHAEKIRGNPDQAGSVTIANNSIRITLPTASVRERHGIFVGNCSSLSIENNHLAVDRVTVPNGHSTRFMVEAVRVFGAMGRRMSVKENHSIGFDYGVRFSPLNRGNNPKPMWVITRNMAEGAKTATLVENVSPAQIIGINENY